MFQVYLQCSPVLVNQQTDEWRSHVIRIKGSIINAPDEEQALVMANAKYPMHVGRLLVAPAKTLH